MALQLQIGNNIARTLLDVLTQHLDEMDDARERMIEDPSFTDVDTFAEVMADHATKQASITLVRNKLVEGMSGDESAG